MKIKNLIPAMACFLIILISNMPAGAYSHANRWGGTTSHYGDTTHATTAWGGSATHTWGEGTTATNRYGDTATHVQGSGSTEFTNPYGGSATHTYGYGTTYHSASGATAYHSPYYGGYYPGYHPPTTVNVYGSTCYNCGGWNTAAAAATGAVVGMAAGAAMASSSSAQASANAYSAGYAAGSANTAYALGAIYATLPAGCIATVVGGTTYDNCGGAWFQPSYGANGVYYRVVPAP
jgi:hypothetical protein